MDAIADATKVKRLTHRETLLIVLGMLLPIFMGSLDQTSVIPGVLAVLRLMINSTLVACCTGRSAGFSLLSPHCCGECRWLR
jgi:hypothetical protein